MISTSSVSIPLYLPLNAVSTGPLAPVQEKYAELRRIVRDLESVVIGFSGGADSALLAKVGFEELGDKAVAVIAISESYPKRERDEAVALAKQIGITTVTVETSELGNESYAANPVNRCYYCKQELFVHLEKEAAARGCRWVAYGANHDDLGDHRPGHIAARERGARAPLLEAGLTKPEIRHISRELGLKTWDKPALACLSSRVPYGTRITAELLNRLDTAEDFLRHELGFKQIRVRHHGDIARLEVGGDEIVRLLDDALRNEISERLKSLGYTFVAMELTGYRSGSLNATIREQN